jgi:hypothetical protein
MAIGDGHIFVPVRHLITVAVNATTRRILAAHYAIKTGAA